MHSHKKPIRVELPWGETIKGLTRSEARDVRKALRQNDSDMFLGVLLRVLDRELRELIGNL